MTTDDRLASGASSLPPNKSSGDIVERLRFDAVRCELQFSKGVAQNIAESAAEIERLRREVAETRALLSLEIDRADLYANSVPVDVANDRKAAVAAAWEEAADWLAAQYPDNANTNAFCAALRSHVRSAV